MRYHVHVYFDDDTADLAWGLRESIETHPANQGLGRFHTAPVGPHPTRQFQIYVERDELEGFLSWLDERRQGLNVLIHPDIDDDLLAHTELARWLGDPQPLLLERFTQSTG